MQHHKYSLTELENMIPWERDVYVAMLIQYIEEENEKIKQQQASMKKRQMDDKTFNTLIKQGEVGLILMDGGADLTDSQIRKVKRVSKDLADDRLNSMMAELAMTPGFQEMMLTPIMAKVLPAVFGKQAVQ